MDNSKQLPVIAFDMDGTLMTHQDAIHPKDVELLTMADPPAIFVPTTGRSLYAIRRIFSEFKICNGSPLSFPMVLQNGSLIYNPGEKLLRYTPLELSTQKELIRLFKTQPDVAFLLFSEDRLRLLNATEFGLSETRRYMFDPEIYDDDAPAVACSKILCIGQDPEKVREIREMVRDFNLEVALSKPTILEFNAPGVNKGSGLEYLVEANGWDKHRVFCAGDGDNDLEMFRRFDVSFTPSTSSDEIKERVTHVIDTHRDGLLSSILHTIEREKI